MASNKVCVQCGKPFVGASAAKTCSEKCRKERKQTSDNEARKLAVCKEVEKLVKNDPLTKVPTFWYIGESYRSAIKHYISWEYGKPLCGVTLEYPPRRLKTVKHVTCERCRMLWDYIFGSDKPYRG